jgi:predicted acyltransferase
MKKSFSFQLILSLLLLLLTDLAYRFFPLEGFNEPWVAFHNLGAWVNNQIEGMETKVIWASMNAIPTTAHTIWGVLCGKLLMSERSAAHKIRIMVIAGAIALAAGYGLDLTGTTPIIKKIATASFVLASGGWTILALALCYWLIDVKQLAPQFSRFFIIVGTNCIFIYLFFQIGGADLLTSVFSPFIKGLFSWSGEFSISILISLTVWASIWYLSYWLFKNRLFIKI